MSRDDIPDRRIMDYSLRNPRGWYAAGRTSQLSGIPKPTLFDDFSQLMRTMELSDPIKELRRKNADSVWAPDLVQPSVCTSIVPWVLSGEPCISRSRIPTSAMFALFDERHLDVKSIMNLYPGVTAEAVSDSIQLEARLRRRTDIPALASV